MSAKCIDNNPENVPLVNESSIGSIILWAGTVVSIAAMNIYFYLNRDISIIVRRRPIHLIVISSFGMVVYSFTMLWRDVDPQTQPCWLFFLIINLTVPCITSPFIVRLTFYANALAIEKIKRKQLAYAALSEVSNFQAFRAYLKGRLAKKNLSEEEYHLSLIFRTKKLFAWVWVVLCTIPFMVYFLINLGLSHSMQNCTACSMALKDSLFTIVSLSLIIVMGLLFCFKLLKYDRNDPLFYVREFFLSWIFGGSFALVAVILQIVDPDGIQTMRKVSWLWLTSPALISMTYFTTVYQVTRAKKNLSKMLLNMNAYSLRSKITANDVLEDIKKDKDMKQKLALHMETELSGELLRFILRVDEWKAFAQDARNDNVSPGKQQKAREIYDEFIRNRAINEINVSSVVREKLGNVFNFSGVAELGVFDEAYKEVNGIIINDTMPRFVAKNASLWNHQKSAVFASINKSERTISVRESSSRDLLIGNSQVAPNSNNSLP